ncbi:MAG: hypothetical protein Q7R54_03370 [bacterium]|nr:hypothetical protein [bacterium]
MSMEKNAEGVPQRPSLFWDTDPAKLDPKANARYIIERIMDFGTDDEVRWMWKTYPRSTLRDALERPRSVVHSKSRALWETMLT